MSTQTLWAANALWAGPAIVARLAAEVPALRQVMTLDELDAKADGPKQLPAALVLLDRMSPNPQEGARGTTTVQQDWLVALAVRGANRDGDRNNQQAGPLIPQIVRALQGWTPPDQLRSLVWRPGLRPNYGRDITYFPMVFSLLVVTA